MQLAIRLLISNFELNMNLDGMLLKNIKKREKGKKKICVLQNIHMMGDENKIWIPDKKI